MRWSETRGALAGALAKVAAEAKDPGKDRSVEAGKRGSWMYATLEGFLPEARALLAKHGCSMVQGMGPAGDVWGVITVISHDSGEWVETFFPFSPRRLVDETSGNVTIQALPGDPQGLNSAFSYARRYAVLGILSLVASGEDDDGQAAQAVAKGRTPNRAKETPAQKEQRQSGHDASWTPEEQRRFMGQLKRFGVTYDQVAMFLSTGGHPNPSGMTQNVRDSLVRSLSNSSVMARLRKANVVNPGGSTREPAPDPDPTGEGYEDGQTYGGA